MWRLIASVLLLGILSACGEKILPPSPASQARALSPGTLEQRLSGEAYFQAWRDAHRETLPDEVKNAPFFASQMVYDDYPAPALEKHRKAVWVWARKMFPDDPLLLQHAHRAGLEEQLAPKKEERPGILALIFAGLTSLPEQNRIFHLTDQQLVTSPGKLESWITALEVGNPRERLKRADGIVEKFPASSTAWVARAGALWNLNQEDAIKAVKKAEDLDPANVQIAELWIAHSEKNVEPSYIRRLQMILKAEPWRGDISANLSEVFFKQKKYAEALDQAEKSVQAFPNFWWGDISRGRALQELGRHEEAVRVFDQVMENFPDFYWPPELRGHSRIALGNMEGAVDDFLRSARIRENNGGSRPHMRHAAGIAFLVLGKTEEAASQFRRLEGLWSEHGLCMTLVCERQWPQAAKAARKMREENSSWADGWLLDYVTHVKDAQPVDVRMGAKLLSGDPWPTKLLEYLAGRSSLADAEQAAQSGEPAKVKERLGKLLLLRGYEALKNKNPSAAGNYFTQAQALLPLLSYESIMAKQELAELNLPVLEVKKTSSTHP